MMFLTLEYKTLPMDYIKSSLILLNQVKYLSLSNMLDNMKLNKDNNYKEFDFREFNKEFKIRFPNKPLPSKDFLIWFLGFFEGNGSFIIPNRNDLSIIINQSKVNLNMLNDIKTMLNMGSMNMESKKHDIYKLVMQNKKDVYLMILLMNGNLVLPIMSAKFNMFLANYNFKLIKNLESIIVLDDRLVLPSLTNSWISGFSDAKATFNIKLINNNKYRINYMLNEKYEINKYILEYMLLLFDESSNLNKSLGNITPHSTSNMWELKMNGYLNMMNMLSYFDKFKLKTNKINNYNKIKEVLNNK
ncbi:putative intron-encoded endonuclease (mitochondrion) [[Candida] railenensis]|uniref:putative intron-encoded endonuclease n=1 Tax=[Candida] railenensis TaxID=45579 RepID=UPI002027F85C|nr:putative intron-encoded endonuclease [[Candida] railenensis]CAH2356101.1 putative intron-encoded endonuclease [[Candida] railenensis]